MKGSKIIKNNKNKYPRYYPNIITIIGLFSLSHKGKTNSDHSLIGAAGEHYAA